MKKENSFLRLPWTGWWPVLAAVVFLSGCVVRRTTRVPPAVATSPVKSATLPELLVRVQSESDKVQTLSATVDLTPTAGSIYSGIIKEYRDVKAFLLAARPASLRMIGQAPVVRTTVFDMTSDGEEFRLLIPSKQKFIVGKNTLRRAAKNPLENLRPQHVVDAILLAGIDSANEKYVHEEAEENGKRYYVITGLEQIEDQLSIRRKLWLERSNLDIVRLQIYGVQGTYLEDVRFSDFRDFQGLRYASQITLTRPHEDYSLTMAILKATFNEPIPPERFQLVQPANVQLIELSEQTAPEVPLGQ